MLRRHAESASGAGALASGRRMLRVSGRVSSRRTCSGCCLLWAAEFASGRATPLLVQQDCSTAVSTAVGRYRASPETASTWASAFGVHSHTWRLRNSAHLVQPEGKRDHQGLVDAARAAVGRRLVHAGERLRCGIGCHPAPFVDAIEPVDLVAGSGGAIGATAPIGNVALDDVFAAWRGFLAGPNRKDAERTTSTTSGVNPSG